MASSFTNNKQNQPWTPSYDDNLNHERLLTLYGKENQVIYLAKCSLKGSSENFVSIGYCNLTKTLLETVLEDKTEFLHYRLYEVFRVKDPEICFDDIKKSPLFSANKVN